MRYIARFQSKIQAIDDIILWVDSILLPCSKYHFESQTYQKVFVDKMGLMLFECVSNLIEHRLLGLNKMQVYSTHRNYIQYIREKENLWICFAFNTRFLTFDIMHKPTIGLRKFQKEQKLCENKKDRKYGGKGQEIMKYLFAHSSIRFIRHYQNCVMRLRIKYGTESRSYQ